MFLEKERAGQTSARSKAVDKFSSGYVENSLEDDDRACSFYL